MKSIKYSTKTHESKQEKSTHIPGEKYQILKYINYFQLNLQMGGEGRGGRNVAKSFSNYS